MLNYYSEDFHLPVFQNDGSPTHVTRLKVAVNMADPISMEKSLYPQVLKIGSFPLWNYGNECDTAKPLPQFVSKSYQWLNFEFPSICSNAWVKHDSIFAQQIFLIFWVLFLHNLSPKGTDRIQVLSFLLNHYLQSTIKLWKTTTHNM